MKNHKCGCKQFDEQLCFESEDGKPLSNIDYCITRPDGMKVKGTTDAEGKTKRIKNTQKPMAIKKVEFFASKHTQPFCLKNHVPEGTLLEVLDLTDIWTTNTDVGTSVTKISPVLNAIARPLTAGEIKMADLVFGKGTLDYGKVKVHDRKYVIAQGNHDILTPNGEMYFPVDEYRPDFSLEKRDTKILFMHEFAHVWQYQLGFAIKARSIGLGAEGGYNYDKTNNPLPKGYRYDPETDKGKAMPDFNHEQQAEIISHYYAAKYLRDVDFLKRIVFLESVLKKFLVKPKDKGLLPHATTNTRPRVELRDDLSLHRF